MDDLLRHCMRELAFDGDLGCDVSRLRHFIEAFYNSQDPPRKRQNIDNSFHSFVWSLLVQQPSVRVGLVPQGSTVEVYIAPQPSKSRKKKKSVSQEPEGTNIEDGEEVPGRLQLIGDAIENLDVLIQQYGNELRVAVDSETSFVAITGSHTRPAKLSPMVYTVLQLISRGRENGLTVIDLGKKTGYDQKACFYLVKQLCELDLIVKLSKGGPGGGNFCIHKYFFTRSAFWEGVRREGELAEHSEHEGQSRDEDTEDTRQRLQFDPIDSRHLASIQLIKTRLSRLLKHSENGLHIYKNLLPTLGFINPTKRDRRFFIVRVRELIKQGFIEKVVAPKVHGYSETLCIRLVEEGRTDTNGIVVQPVEVGDDEQEAAVLEDKEGNMPVANLTIHRQILKLLEEVGYHGMTLTELSSRLGNFDKRTMELLLSRMERSLPPPHLADLATCEFIENQGRERRLRFYILPGYLSFIQRESIDHEGRTAEYTSRDLSHSRQFFSLPQDMFYKDQAQLIAFEDGYRDRIAPPKDGERRKVGRPRKNATKPKTVLAAEDEEARTSKPRKAPVKPPVDVEDNIALLESTRRVSKRGAKRKRINDTGENESQPPPKKQRGRKSTKANTQPKAASDIMDDDLYPEPVTKTPVDHAIPEVNPMSLMDQTGLDTSTRDHDSTQVVPTLSTSVLASGSDRDATVPNDGTRSGASMMEPVKGTNILAVSSSAETLKLPAELSRETTNDDGVNVYNGPGSQALFGTPRAATNPPVGSKRGHDQIQDDATSVTLLKRQKPVRSQSRAVVNISQMRAENEFMRVVEASGGIANITSKEFTETHAHVIATMLDAGEPTSMPAGTQPDKRTIRKIFGRLEERGRVKILTVTVAPRIGQPRPVKLAYEPGLDQARLDKYLKFLQEVPPPLPFTHKKLENPIDYTRPKRHHARHLGQEGLLDGGNGNDGWRRDLDISGLTDDAIRSKILLDVQTVAQLYGFLIGKARRARELHQFTLSHLQAPEVSPYVVSKVERIIAFSYYHNDLPLSTYFSIISATKYNAELSALMETPQGPQTLVRSLPSDLHEMLQIGRARARDKILGLLVILASLKLVTPLCPSSAENPYLTCEPNGDHPTHFDVTSINGTRHNASSPSYWVFNTIAPIYLYSTQHLLPPFHRDMFVRTADESMPFWLELQSAFLNKESVEPIASMDSITGPCVCTPEVQRGLRRKQSWTSSYVLSWIQKQYLHRWTNPSNAYTPLSDPDGGRECLDKICRVISAPADAVYAYFVTTRSMLMNEMDRIRERERKREEGRERKATKGRALLAEKAAEARRRVEAEWDALVLRVHPTPTPYGYGLRLKQLRARYLQARGSIEDEKWAAAILEALSGPRPNTRSSALSRIASSMPLKSPRHVGISRPPPIVSTAQRSVTVLIERQRERGAALQAMPKRNKRRQDATMDSEGENKVTTGIPRRQRFQWTSEYDELARDASAIIRSRCRSWNRMDWTALDQLFPFLTRNNARQRIVALRQEAGGESYLRLLEDKWHELWLEYRGTEMLPDDNPNDPSEFDAIAHIEFLRKYIDKRALRAGISDADLQHTSVATLTETVCEFFSRWDMNEKPRPFNKMDLVWTAVGDEHREKAFLGETFSLTRGNYDHRNDSDIGLNGLAESGLKMALTTPDEDYDSNSATQFLNSIGKDATLQASEDLLARGAISESGHRHGHKKFPGRKFKISSLNKDAMGGLFHSDFFAEACAIDDLLDVDAFDWREWSATATDGEMAALVDLISARKVDFEIDVSEPASHRQHLDWNSKKVDDDQIESTLTVRFCPSLLEDEPPTDTVVDSCPVSVSMDLDKSTEVIHDQSCEALSPCRKVSQGVITCAACFDSDQDVFRATLDAENRRLFSGLMEALDKAGWKGLKTEVLSAYSDQMRGDRTIIGRITSGSAPQCYWVGYTHPVLVSRRHIRHWTVSIPDLSVPRLEFPRRWLNLKGEKMEEVWNAGLRAVVGVLVLRPGISQGELRQRLISVYDRQELNDLLHHLSAEGLITKVMSMGNPDLQFKDLRGMDVVEEQKTYWKLTGNAWYRVYLYA